MGNERDIPWGKKRQILNISNPSANMTPTYRPVFSDHLPVHYTREDFIHLVIVKKVKPSLPKSDCEVINLLKR